MPDRPWWKNRGVLMSILFVIFCHFSVIFTILMIGTVVSRIDHHAQFFDFSYILMVIEQSFLGCTIGGVVLAVRFGLPHGFIRVLDRKVDLMDMEQEIDLQREDRE